MKRAARIAILVFAVIAPVSLRGSPGVVHLRDGTDIRGEVDDSKLGVVVVQLHGVEETIPRDQVQSVELAPDLDGVFKTRLGALAKDDIGGRLALAQWCFDATRYDLARRAVDEALGIDARNAAAVAMRVKVDRAVAAQVSATHPSIAVAGISTRPAEPNEYLSAEQIYSLRRHELINADKEVAVTFHNNVRRDFLAMVGGDPTQFYSLTPVDQARRILKQGDPAMGEDVLFENDGATLRQFLQRIGPTIVGGCGNLGCHNSKTPNGAFGLFVGDARAAAWYTNFYILKSTACKVADREKRLSVRSLAGYYLAPSLIIEYGLPQRLATYPHPNVPHFQAAFSGMNDLHVRQIIQWEQGFSIGNYQLDYTPPWARATTQPAH